MNFIASNSVRLSAARCTRVARVLLVATLLVGCGKYGLAKQDSDPSTAQESTSPEQWLNAWSALQSQAGDADESVTVDHTAPDPRETSFASGVVDGAERDPRPTSNHRGGSRLRPRVVLTDEGQQGWVGWRDSERDEDCAFQRDAEGTLRCLPSRTTPRTYFVDTQCTERVAAVSEQDESSVDYALQREGSQCTVGVRVYPLRGAIEAPTSVFVQDHRGRCVAAAMPSAATFRAVGDEVPSTEFVAARQGIEGKDARVKAVGLVADDGAISVTGFVDSELQTPCMWQGTHHTTCVPRATDVSTFADEVCSEPLLQPDRNKCAPEVTFGVAPEVDGCGTAYYRPGASYQGNTVYEVTAESYQSREIAADEASTMLVGERVQPEQLATGNLERMTASTTRLSGQHWTTPDGGVWFGGWYDNRLETPCSFVPTNDDEWQCLPRDTGDQVLYADAACTQPVTELQGPDGCGEAAAPPSFVTQYTPDANGTSVPQVRRVLSARPYLATVYEQTDAGCQGRAVAENHRHFDLSQPLPANSFVRGLPTVL